MRNNNLARQERKFGVGLNDSGTHTYKSEKVDGKWRIVWVCPYYRTWGNMLSRCYSLKWLDVHPTYKGCTVCDEWLTFSNFKAWMEKQDWEGKQLDKDILIPGNKVYSPETCVFVTRQLNMFLCGSIRNRGDQPKGVTWCVQTGRAKATCSNPFTGGVEHLGRFSTPEEAHEAWRQRKHELACQYADMQTDPRIAEALRTRFAVPTPFTSNETKEVCNA